MVNMGNNAKISYLFTFGAHIELAETLNIGYIYLKFKTGELGCFVP
jgi:hypothetical protein